MKQKPKGVNASDLSRLRRWLVRLGLFLLIPSLLYLPFAMLGILPTEMFAIGGTSGLKIIGSFAVFGCLAAAVGFWDS